MYKEKIAFATGLRLSTLQELTWDVRLMLLRLSNQIVPSRRKRLRQWAALTGIKLHFGSGPRIFPGWLNVDGYPYSGLDAQIDLRYRLPLADNSCCYIFSEHVLEHFRLEDGKRICEEFFRLLKVGGVARIIVPDAEKFWRGYQAKDLEWFQSVNNFGDTALEGVNCIYYNHFHKCMYDFDLLHSILSEAGFEKIVRSMYLGSAHSDLHQERDDPVNCAQSLYVEATKN